MKYSIFFLVILCLLARSVQAGVKIVDGDSLEMDGKSIRLIYIDAPEYKQTCFDVHGFEYNCGSVSTKALKEIISDKEVRCNSLGVDIYKRDLSECFVDDININIEMLKQGFAVSYYTDKEEYISMEEYAKEKKLGLWQGKFMRPEFYRVLNRR